VATIYPKRIPLEIERDPRRKSERILFDSFREFLGDEVIVYYSRTWRTFNLDKNKESIFVNGEADFIIVWPDYGILVIECKGGGVEFKDGIYTTTNKNFEKIKIKNPYKQVDRSRYRIIEHILHKNLLGRTKFELTQSIIDGVFFPQSKRSSWGQFDIDQKYKQTGFEDNLGLRINTRGETSERKTPSIEIVDGASCGDVLGVLWEDFGLEALESIGIIGDEAEEIWRKQNTKPKPFGKFLKSLDNAREKAKLSSLIPTKSGELGGACGHIVGLIRTGLLEGLGKAERIATSRHSSISEAAAAWAWLLAAERSSGQEWHFDGDARNKASAWMNTTKQLLDTGKQLLDSPDEEIERLQNQWHTQLNQLKQDTGES